MVRDLARSETRRVAGAAFPLDPAVNGYLNFAVGSNDGSQPKPWVDSHWLTLRRVAPGVATTPWPKWNGGSPPPREQTWSAPVTFQIQRQPMATMSPPLELPTGVVVDLDCLGHERGRHDSCSTRIAGSVIVMFSPSGNVRRVLLRIDTADESSRGPKPLTEPMFFLVGKESQLDMCSRPARRKPTKRRSRTGGS